MFKVSILRAKIKRSSTTLIKTVLWDDLEINFSNNSSLVQLFLNNNEEVIMHYKQSNSYKWILTSERLIFPNYFKQFHLSELVHVDFNNIKENPDVKMTNTELDLSTHDENFKIFLEEGTWPLFFEIFNFIIKNNK